MFTVLNQPITDFENFRKKPAILTQNERCDFDAQLVGYPKIKLFKDSTTFNYIDGGFE